MFSISFWLDLIRFWKWFWEFFSELSESYLGATFISHTLEDLLENGNISQDWVLWKSDIEQVESNSKTDRESNWISSKGSIKSCNKSPQGKSVKLWSMQKDCKKFPVGKTSIFHSGKCRNSLISAQLQNVEILTKHVTWAIGMLSSSAGKDWF